MASVDEQRSVVVRWEQLCCTCEQGALCVVHDARITEACVLLVSALCHMTHPDGDRTDSAWPPTVLYPVSLTTSTRGRGQQAIPSSQAAKITGASRLRSVAHPSHDVN